MSSFISPFAFGQVLSAQGVRILKYLSVAVLLGVLSGCSWTNFSLTKKSEPRLSPRVVHYGEPVPKGGGQYKIGKPYQVGSRWYYPRVDRNYDEVGVASWYGHMFHGRYTANGEIYDMDALTAAHPTLPIPSYVRVTNQHNGRSLVLRVNDRGPYANDRIIDLSRYAARLLKFEKNGTARVRVTYLKPAPLNGNDRYERRYLASQSWRKSRRKYRRYSRRHKRRYDRITTGTIRRRRAYRNKRNRRNRRSARKYVVQAGVFQSRWNANRVRGKLKRFGRASVQKFYSRRLPIYRVTMGPYRNRRFAEKMADRIAGAGVYDAIVINR